jgi:glycosyltransferase involved in cell wall biosynthesis
MFIRKVLILHNRYRWRGGEDATFEAEAALLREHGHQVVEHTADNMDILAHGKLAIGKALHEAAWSRKSYASIRELAEKTAPEIVHVHNFWYALSPSVLSACHDSGLPVVLRLPNFRLLCPGAVLLNKEGRPCQDCVEAGPEPGVKNRCYHGSWFASKAVARMIKLNKKRGTWEKDVDLFLVPSEFCRNVFVRGGFPADKLVVKPNFVNDPYRDREVRSAESGVRNETSAAKRVLFIGRLSREKGLKTLLAAWKTVEAEHSDAELRLVGDGPMLEELQELAEGLNVSFPGRVEGEALFAEIQAARCTALPSECYETFGRVVVESYACSRPAVVSNIGGPAELVRDGETGLLFEPGNVDDLVTTLVNLLSDPSLCERMGEAARQEYEAKYTPDHNYELLTAAYEQAIENHKTC